MSVETIFTCWTKFKGGKFKSDSNKTWHEYNPQNVIIATFEQLDGDDYDLAQYEAILLDKKTGILIKLDKKYSRKAKIPLNDNFDLALMELFKLKWNLIETGFWDTLDENTEKAK